MSRAKLAQLAAERFELLEAGGDVAHYGGEPANPALRILEWNDGEFDRYLAAVFHDCGNCEDITLTIAALAALHHPAVTIPMTLP